MAAYYPRRLGTFQDLQRAYPGFEMYDEKEEDRLEHVQIMKSKGKGAPKKKRTAAGKESFVADQCAYGRLTMYNTESKRKPKKK
jgi:small subunit ribosomal protein S33